MQIIVLRATGARNLQLSWLHIGVCIALLFFLGATLAWLLRPLLVSETAVSDLPHKESISATGMSAITNRLGQLQARIEQIDNLSARLGRALGISAGQKRIEVAEDSFRTMPLPPAETFRSTALGTVPTVLAPSPVTVKATSPVVAPPSFKNEHVKAMTKPIPSRGEEKVKPGKARENMPDPKKEEVHESEQMTDMVVPPADSYHYQLAKMPTSEEELSGIMNQMAQRISFQQIKLGQMESELGRRQLLALSWPSQKPVIDASNSSTFGWRRDPFTGIRTFHEGLDLAAPAGHSILAAAPGKVVFAGMHSGYGLMAEIDHGRGIRTRYGHAQGFNVRAGDLVRAGQEIGQVGSTGRSTGSHLHFEVRINGVPQNPQRFLGVSAASLLAHAS